MKRSSNSLLIELVWQVQYDGDGELTVTADDTWDMIFVTLAGTTNCVITGPKTQTAHYPYYRGQTALGVQFKIGAYLPAMPARDVINASRIVPTHQGMVELNGVTFEIPNFDSAEAFADALYTHGVLAYDHIVAAALSGRMSPAPRRSIQRHFAEATGVTPKLHQQIVRAQQAAALLRQGMAKKEVAQVCGYYDQAHMNRALKHFLRSTPQQIEDGDEA